MCPITLWKAENLLRLGAAGLIPEMLEERGITADAFGRTKIQRQRFADPERVVRLAWLAWAFKSAAATTVQTEFGLMVGLRAGSRIVGQIRDRTPDDGRVSAALMRVISQPASFPNSLLAMSVSGNKCTIECAGLPNLVAAMSARRLRYGIRRWASARPLRDRGWRPEVFRFAYQQPADPLRHTALLQAPAAFDADVTALGVRERLARPRRSHLTWQPCRGSRRTAVSSRSRGPDPSGSCLLESGREALSTGCCVGAGTETAHTQSASEQGRDQLHPAA